MKDALRSALELGVVVPAAVLCLLPMKEHLREKRKWMVYGSIPFLILWALLAGWVCAHNGWESNTMLPFLLLFAGAYVAVVDLPLEKSVSAFLGVCGVFACLTNLATAVDAVLASGHRGTWFTLGAGLVFHAICWLFVLLAWHPATHGVRDFLTEREVPVTWHVFWVLPLSFIFLNVFIQPQDYATLYAGRMLILYPLIVGCLLGLLLFCYFMFFHMAREMGKNMRLQRQNEFLQMQTAQYETLQNAIGETRQARHDLRHHFTAIHGLIEKEAWEELRNYVESARESIPGGELNLCDNSAADGVAGHYAVQFRREGISFDCLLDLPQKLPVAEMDVCVVLANLLENALEASRKLPRTLRHVALRGEIHGKSLVLIQVENTYGEQVKEEKGVFRSTKRPGNGIGLQSVRRIAEKNGGYYDFAYDGRVFRASVMLRGEEG